MDLEVMYARGLATGVGAILPRRRMWRKSGIHPSEPFAFNGEFDCSRPKAIARAVPRLGALMPHML